MTRGVKADINKYITNIEQYLKVGCSLHEACLHGCVPYTTVIDYYNNDEEIRKKIDRLSNTPILIARTSVVDGMAADPKLALDYLKNKKSDEFGTREKKEVTGEFGVKLSGLPETDAWIERVIGRRTKETPKTSSED